MKNKKLSVQDRPASGQKIKKLIYFSAMIFVVALFFVVPFASHAAIDQCDQQHWSPSYHQIDSPIPGYNDYSVQIFEYGACNGSLACELECGIPTNKTTHPDWYIIGGQCVDKCGKTLSGAIECPYCKSEMIPGSVDRSYCCIIDTEIAGQPVAKSLVTNFIYETPDVTTVDESYTMRDTVNGNFCCCYTTGAKQCGVRPVEDGCPENTEVSDYDRCIAAKPMITLEVPIGTTRVVEDLPHYISIVYNYSIYAISILAVVMIMFYGFNWLMAAGNKSKIDQAKEKIVDALIGLALAFGSYIILTVINPDILSLRIPGLERVLGITQEATQERAGANAGQYVVPATVISRINQLMPVYKKVTQEEDIPWELLATIHYKEAGNNGNKSAFNGFDICNDKDNSICSACKGKGNQTFENDLKCAAELLKEKANSNYKRKNCYNYGKLELNSSTNDATNLNGVIAHVTFRYNGVGYCNIDKSPYVANNFDATHQSLGGRGCRSSNCCGDKRHCKECCWFEWTETSDGTLIFFQKLKDPANYDASGKLISLNLS